jgi:hypothetical protein
MLALVSREWDTLFLHVGREEFHALHQLYAPFSRPYNRVGYTAPNASFVHATITLTHLDISALQMTRPS